MRGKHAAAAASRETAKLRQECATLRAQLEAAKAEHRRALLDAESRHSTDRQELIATTAEHVERMLTARAEELGEGISAAAWTALRVAMTRHLAWLFFKGFLAWDRLAGDREMLTFIQTYGDMQTWWVLTSKYGHMESRSLLRETVRVNKRSRGVAALLGVMADIDGALRGDAKLRASREQLDKVVLRARDAFISVTLDEMMKESLAPTATESDGEIHALILESLQEFRHRPS